MASATSRRRIEPSATDTITSASETAFSKTIPIEGYELMKGAQLRFGGSVKHPTTDGTETQQVRAYIGTAKDNTGVMVADTGAVDLANDDVSSFEGHASVKVHGAASTAVICGSSRAAAKTGVAGLQTTFDKVEAQLDTTAKMYLTVTCQHSDAAGNVSRLDDLWLEVVPFETIP